MGTIPVVVEVDDDEEEGEIDISPTGEVTLVESMTNFEPLGIGDQAPTSGLKTFGGLSSDQEMMEKASMTVIGSCVPDLEVDVSNPTPYRVVTRVDTFHEIRDNDNLDLPLAITEAEAVADAAREALEQALSINKEDGYESEHSVGVSDEVSEDDAPPPS
ncbi:hypothetical protein HAX54_020316 [Datura stramonium]|uniref:Uncharacterized protein n=1 Tax=Datura stramonium TaxID=4076 RepID=A0ABS8UQV4_DATST|nr:hypothetical protein [Datura stramonium]